MEERKGWYFAVAVIIVVAVNAKMSGRFHKKIRKQPFFCVCSGCCKFAVLFSGHNERKSRKSGEIVSNSLL